MGGASFLDLVAAMFLIGSHVSGAADVIAPDHPAITGRARPQCCWGSF